VGGVAGRGVALCSTGILGNPANGCGGTFCDCRVGGLGAGRNGGGLGAGRNCGGLGGGTGLDGGTGGDDLG